MMRATLAWLLLIGVAHAQTTAAPAGTQINPNRVIIGPQPGQVAGGDALAAESTRAQAAEAIAVVNRPTIAPLTTTVRATATTIYPAGTYVSISIKVTTPGAITTCTGDGGATSGVAAYPQRLRWPTIVGGAMPPGPIVCTGQTAINAEAH